MGDAGRSEKGKGKGKGGASAAKSVLAGVALFRNPLIRKVKRAASNATGSHSRTATQLPDDWAKDEDMDGNKYYYSTSTGETSWDPPPGSVGVVRTGIAAGT